MFNKKRLATGYVVIVTTKFQKDVEVGDIGVVCSGCGLNLPNGTWYPNICIVYFGKDKVAVVNSYCLKIIDEVLIKTSMAYYGWNPYEEDKIEEEKTREMEGRKAVDEILSQCPYRKRT